MVIIVKDLFFIKEKKVLVSAIVLLICSFTFFVNAKEPSPEYVQRNNAEDNIIRSTYSLLEVLANKEVNEKNIGEVLELEKKLNRNIDKYKKNKGKWLLKKSKFKEHIIWVQKRIRLLKTKEAARIKKAQAEMKKAQEQQKKINEVKVKQAKSLLAKKREEKNKCETLIDREIKSIKKAKTYSKYSLEEHRKRAKEVKSIEVIKIESVPVMEVFKDRNGKNLSYLVEKDGYASRVTFDKDCEVNEIVFEDGLYYYLTPEVCGESEEIRSLAKKIPDDFPNDYLHLCLQHKGYLKGNNVCFCGKDAMNPWSYHCDGSKKRVQTAQERANQKKTVRKKINQFIRDRGGLVGVIYNDSMAKLDKFCNEYPELKKIKTNEKVNGQSDLSGQ